MSAIAEPRRPGVLSVIAALLLPPLGAFLVRGLGPAFWVTVLLTLIGWAPGVVFALLLLIRPEFMPRG